MNIPDDCGYEVKFIHNICLNDPGVPFGFINWCLDNCLGKWGWWFSGSNTPKDSIAYMSFEIEEDLVLFGLTHDLTYKHSN